MNKVPSKVFISYSHDGPEHEERVLDLADRLREDGIDAEVDQYLQSPPEGWPAWCESQIENADFVLMVCTETYHRRVKGDEAPGKGLGVVCEARIIRQLVYDSGAVSAKFIPVLFSDGSADHIPLPVKGWTRYVVNTEDGYEALYRRLSGQPWTTRPPLGSGRQLPARPPRHRPPAAGLGGKEIRGPAAGGVQPEAGSQLGRGLLMPSSRIADFAVFRDIDAPWCPEMVALPAGEFLMGSPDSEEGRPDHEGPQHRVTIGYRFALGRYPITFDEYDHFCDVTKRKKPKDVDWGRGRRPVINVSWHDAQAYCEWLAEAVGKPYRLPSDEEWEYACRAGTTTPFSFGETITEKDANFGLNVGTTDVGIFPPNPWGLHDMHGNVWEWVADHWHGNYSGAPADGSAWIYATAEAGAGRVRRGGSWKDNAHFVRSVCRDLADPGSGINSIGFRCTRVLA
jgi:formylglycine-generating enzyme required for sulfatase activity